MKQFHHPPLETFYKSETLQYIYEGNPVEKRAVLSSSSSWVLKFLQLSEHKRGSNVAFSLEQILQYIFKIIFLTSMQNFSLIQCHDFTGMLHCIG